MTVGPSQVQVERKNEAQTSITKADEAISK